MGKLLFGVMLVKAPRMMAGITLGGIGLLALAFVGYEHAAAMIGGMAMTLLFLSMALGFVCWAVRLGIRIFQFVVLTALRSAVVAKRIARRVNHASF